MKVKVIFLAIISILCSLSAVTMQQVYEAAESGVDNGIEYDRILELENEMIYTGGLQIGKVFFRINNTYYGPEGEDVRIIGNGAVIDLQGTHLEISYCNNRMDISDCVVINGDIRFRGINTGEVIKQPFGSVKYVTIYNADDYGIRLLGTGGDITLERNIIVDAIDTGWDFIFTNGMSTSWLPTGRAICLSYFDHFGPPSVIDNWSFFSVDTLNTSNIYHYTVLCEYG